MLNICSEICFSCYT